MASISLEAKVDVISGLPDEILVNILSFLHIEDAIKTTLLLKRFKNLWRSFPRLILDKFETWCVDGGLHNPSDNEKFANLIHHLLIFHERMSIDELCLRHYFFFKYSKDPGYSTNPGPEVEIRIIEEMRFAGVIDSLVSFAIIKRCKVLALDFITIGKRKLQQGYRLPTIVYRSIHLTKLSLDACDITSCDVVLLKSLKMLHFREVVMSDNAMEKILFGCPSLEELSVVCCYGLHNLRCSNNVKLEKFKIIHPGNKLLTV